MLWIGAAPNARPETDLDFSLSHHSDTADAFRKQLDKFLLKATKKHTPSKTKITKPVAGARDSLIADLCTNGECVTGLNDIRDYFEQKYIQRAFDIADVDALIGWDRGDEVKGELSDKRDRTLERIFKCRVLDGSLKLV